MNILELKNIGLTYYSKNGETQALKNVNIKKYTATDKKV